MFVKDQEECMRCIKHILTLCLTLAALWFPAMLRAENPREDVEFISQRFREFQAVLKGNNPGEISGFFSFPYRLPYPMTAIRSADEFTERIDEVLDDTVRNRLLEADPDEDLSLMGWRGIMLDHGLVWFAVDDMRVISINHRPQKYLEKRAEVLARMKETLHPSLRTFHLPILEQETYSYRFRVDQLEDNSYRYAAWPRDKTFRDEPSLVINGGAIEFYGSGGNRGYSFVNGSYRYVVGVHTTGHRAVPRGDLVVYQNKQEILNQTFPEVFYSNTYRVWIEYLPASGVRLLLWSREKDSALAPDVHIPEGQVTYSFEPGLDLYAFHQEGRRYEVTNPSFSDPSLPPGVLRISDDSGEVLREDLAPSRE